MSEIDEITATLIRLQGEFEDLGVRGLRSVGAERLVSLRGLRDEFDRIGAAHIAARIGSLADAIENDDRRSAEALLLAQSSLRLFERILTLETVGSQLAMSLNTGEDDTDDDEEGDDT